MCLYLLIIPSWAATAAAVLATGTLVQSPIPNMLGYLKLRLHLWVLFEFLAYFVCCSVSLLTLRNPAGSVNSLLELRAGGVAIGGVI